MILKKLGNTRVVSDDGREIRIQFRLDYIAYMENNRALYVGIKRVDGQGGKTLIKIDALHGITNWLPPNAEEMLTQNKKMEILDFFGKGINTFRI